MAAITKRFCFSNVFYTEYDNEWPHPSTSKDRSPSFGITSTEEGKLKMNGSCKSTTLDVSTGENEITWSTENYDSGLYLCRLEARGIDGERDHLIIRMAVIR